MHNVFCVIVFEFIGRNKKMKFLENSNFSGQNMFFNDQILLQSSLKFPKKIIDELGDIGAFVSSEKAYDLARLANIFKPKLTKIDRWGHEAPKIELHPAYHALVRRSKWIGIASSLWENRSDEKKIRYQSRAIRLFLTAGLENGHLTELITTNASIGALITNDKLYQSWKPLLLSRQHDSTIGFAKEKKGVSFSFAFQDEKSSKMHNSHDISFATQAQILNDKSYTIQGVKNYVSNPHCDAFLVTAYVGQELSCFFVPFFLEDNILNGIKTEELIYESGYRSCPLAKIRFNQSQGYLLGKIGEGQRIIDDIEMMIRFDEAVISAGSLRAALNFALSIFITNKNMFHSSLTKHILADIALDVVAAEIFIMRLARAFDSAIEDKNEAAYARVMTPIAAFWIHNLVAPIISELLGQLPEFAYAENAFLPRMLNDASRRCLRDNNNNLLVQDVVQSAKRAPRLFKEMIEYQGKKIRSIGQKTIEVLHAATDIALSDSAGARLLVEQLAYSASLAALYEFEIPFITESFAESRLAGQWRSSYGMFRIRHNEDLILSFLYPES